MDPTIDISGADARRPAPVALKIVVLAGPDEGKEAPIRASCDVGTDPGCDFPLTDSSISRRHARISIDRGRILVRDLESRNGTFIGDARVRDATLPLGAVLRLGRTRVAIQPRWLVREIAPSTARGFGELYAESLAMREVFAVLERVAESDLPVLVEGERGTGKALVGRALHAASARAKGPFVAFDCAVAASDRVALDLFGPEGVVAEPAAFGAVGDVPGDEGAFQQARGGTLFIEEVGALPVELQPRLLRALETRELVASDGAARPVEVRVVVSTSRDLRAEVERGQFRADLLHRLDVVRVRIPPLRSRPEDIPGLVARMLVGKLPARDEPGGENMQKLLGHPWPGNVAELKEVVERAARAGAAATGKRKAPPFADLVFDLGPIPSAPATLGTDPPGVSGPAPYAAARGQLLASFDRAFVAELTRRFGDDLDAAARAAGMARTDLDALLRRTGRAGPQNQGEDQAT